MRTILIVEDDPAILKLVKSILLEAEAYEILSAKTGKDGLRIGLAFPRPIDLLLANVILPGILGTDVAEKLKEAWPAMRVILLTGKADGDLAVLHGGWQILEKDHLKADLLARVKALLERVKAEPGSHAGSGR